jgi:SAM-dependent methyltransferase
VAETFLKRHWYDGWFYSILIDSDRSNLRNNILGFLENDKSVLDIGCGTGGFALRIATCSKYVLGVDISESMIRTANQRKERLGISNIDFISGNAMELSTLLDRHFDHAVLSFLLHEINPQYRLKIIEQAHQCADALLIYDYFVPQPRNFSAALIKVIEYLGGHDHYKNFLDFKQNGGIRPLLNSLGLTIREDRIKRPGVFYMVKAS